MGAWLLETMRPGLSETLLSTLFAAYKYIQNMCVEEDLMWRGMSSTSGGDELRKYVLTSVIRWMMVKRGEENRKIPTTQRNVSEATLTPSLCFFYADVLP